MSLKEAKIKFVKIKEFCPPVSRETFSVAEAIDQSAKDIIKIKNGILA